MITIYSCHIKQFFKKLGILFLLLFISYGIGITQNDDVWKNDLAEKLQSEEDCKFLHLVGYFNDYFFTEMKFAYDDQDWVGNISLSDQGIQYKLEGGKVNGQILLIEYDENDQHIGYWTISKEREKYICTWKNIRGSMGFELEMFEELWNPGLEKDYGQEFASFIGTVDSNEIGIYTKKTMSGKLEIEVFDNGKNTFIPISWDCNNNNCSELILSTSSTLLPEKFKIQILPDQLRLKDTKESDMYIVLKQDLRHKTKLKKRITENYQLIVEFPDIDNRVARKHIEQISDKLYTTLENQLNALINMEDYPDNRLDHSAIAWFDIFYWDNNLISGKWTIQKSWNNDIESIQINYSIKKNKEIDIKKQFKKDFDLEFYLSHFIESEKKELSGYKNLLVRNRLQKASFDFINFDPEGIVLSTDFNTLFGAFEMKIPFDDVEQDLKKRTELRRIFETKK